MKKKELLKYSFLFYCFVKLFNQLHFGNQNISIYSGFIHRSITVFSITVIFNVLFVKYMFTHDFVGDSFVPICVLIVAFDLYYFFKIRTYKHIIELYKDVPDKLSLMVGRVYLLVTLFLTLLWWYLDPEVHW